MHVQLAKFDQGVHRDQDVANFDGDVHACASG